MHSPGGWNLFGRLSGMGHPADRFEVPLPNVGWLVGMLASTIEWLGFWLAVALPVAYVPLFLSGFSRPLEALVFAALLALHVLSLVTGYAHDPA